MGLIRVRSLAGGFRSRVVTALAVLAVFASGLTVGSILSPAEPAAAADAALFDPGYIISDAEFYNGNAMTEAQIQNFLNSAAPGACGGAGCLKQYSQTTINKPQHYSDTAGAVQCTPYTGGANESAARIIDKVQRACGISAKVLLVTLQKERALVTKTSAIPADFTVAMGMGCPDTAPCDSEYYGFFNQVWSAAKQFKTYRAAPNYFNFRAGHVSTIQWHPNAACGSTQLHIANAATAALYNYTPYRPNASAMANLYGTGDTCASYGNRNFWVFYSDWFGSPTGAVNPIGALDAVTPVVGGATVFGWAFDPDTTDPVSIHVYVNNAYSSTITANQARSDVGAAYPGRTNHGFRETLTLRAGNQSVCLYAINVGPGTINTPLGCRTITVPAPPPQEPPANESGAVYRFWSDSFNGHFYTRSVAERNDIIAKYPGVWKYETVAFGAFGAPVEGTVPVYRFWSNTYNGHFYTTSEAEKNQIIATYPRHIWQYETVAFYVYPNASAVPGTVPMSRFWSAAYGHHFYTASEAEAASVRANYPHIWAFEGQVFRVPSAKPQAAPLP